jgi:hypothetical protein
MNFVSLVNEVINECNLAGGSASVLGSGVSNTATPFSGDNYAPKDARMPKNLYGGVITRQSLKKKKKKTK